MEFKVSGSGVQVQDLVVTELNVYDASSRSKLSRSPKPSTLTSQALPRVWRFSVMVILQNSLNLSSYVVFCNRNGRPSVGPGPKR